MKFLKYSIPVLILFIAGCAGTKKPEQKAPPPETKSPYDESFDPLSLNDDDIKIGPQTEPGREQENIDTSQQTENSPMRRQVSGFRVQILATSNIETASLTEQEATDRFGRLGHNTYLLFEAPLWKLRLGDCATRQEAEQLREQALNFGYSGAFIVKTKIMVEQ
jgi:hypothetical protein